MQRFILVPFCLNLVGGLLLVDFEEGVQPRCTSTTSSFSSKQILSMSHLHTHHALVVSSLGLGMEFSTRNGFSFAFPWLISREADSFLLAESRFGGWIKVLELMADRLKFRTSNLEPLLCLQKAFRLAIRMAAAAIGLGGHLDFGIRSSFTSRSSFLTCIMTA